MSSPIIWFGNAAKNLKAALKFSEFATIFSGSVDPSATATAGAAGDIYISTSTFKIYQKQDAGTTTNWTALSTFAGSLTANRIVVTDGSGTVTTDTGITYDVSTDTLTVANLTVSGTTTTVNTTNLSVSDKLITLNSGGAAASGGGSGIEIEENAVITGYEKTSADRNSWELKAPNTSGIATITPGAGGITLNQSSHDPVTFATYGAISVAEGATVSGQVITLRPANTSFSGGVSTIAQSFAGLKTFTSGIADTTLTASRAVTTNGSQQLVSSATTATELGFVSGVTSAIQTQINNKVATVTGDIVPTSFAAAQTQTGATVTGLAFANGTVRSFKALVSVFVDATTDLYEVFELLGIQRGSDWAMSTTSTGDTSLFSFSIDASGQVLYDSGTYAGFSSAAVRFRAITLPV